MHSPCSACCRLHETRVAAGGTAPASTRLCGVVVDQGATPPPVPRRLPRFRVSAHRQSQHGCVPRRLSPPLRPSTCNPIGTLTLVSTGQECMPAPGKGNDSQA